MKRIDKITGPGSLQKAKQKAIYGHANWVWYKGRDGGGVAERETAESVKRALLAVGTKGHYTLLCANCGSGMMMHWSMGLNCWYQLKYTGDYRKGPGIPYNPAHRQKYQPRKPYSR